MSDHRILIVDDEPDIQELVQLTLQKMSLNSIAVGTIQAAKDHLHRHDFVLCLADMRLPDGDGIDLVRWLQQHQPELPVAVITAFGNMEGAVNTLKAGAFDYVSKPVDLQVLRDLVQAALRLSEQHTPAANLDLLGTSEPMRALRTMIGKLARSQAPVLIHGPSGVGKELVARLIHQQSPRREGAFVPVNCGAISSELMESEFFGHIKGSFSGAHHDQAGLFQAADQGTLFLDEIADLPLNMQVKLLRAIQEKAIKPVGSNHEQPVNTRILSATHQSLAHLVTMGQFRQDLFYRLNVIEIQVPPLAERPDDIVQIAHHVVERLALAQERPQLTISSVALSELGDYHFPGNVRELENIIERAATLCEHECIQPRDLHLSPLQELQAPVSSKDVTQTSLDHYLLEKEKELILQALESHQWNKTRAAQSLGLSFRALRYRLEKLKLNHR